MLNLTAVLEHSAIELPEKTAIIFGDKRFSYSQINAVANQVANGLIAAGITRTIRNQPGGHIQPSA